VNRPDCQSVTSSPPHTRRELCKMFHLRRCLPMLSFLQHFLQPVLATVCRYSCCILVRRSKYRTSTFVRPTIQSRHSFCVNINIRATNFLFLFSHVNATLQDLLYLAVTSEIAEWSRQYGKRSECKGLLNSLQGLSEVNRS